MNLANRPICFVLLAFFVAGCAATPDSGGDKNGNSGASKEKKDTGVKIGGAAVKPEDKAAESKEEEAQWWTESETLNKGLFAVGGNIMLNSGMMTSSRLAANSKAKQNLQANIRSELAFCIRIWAKSSQGEDAKAIAAVYQDPKFLDAYVSMVKNAVVVKMRTPKGGRGTLFVLMKVKADDVYNDFVTAVVKTNTRLRIDKKPVPSKQAEVKLKELAGKLKVRLSATQDSLTKQFKLKG